MPSLISVSRTIALLLMVSCGAISVVWAQQFFETQRAFRLDKVCWASPTMTGGPTSPRLEVGQLLVARAVDRKANPSRVLVKVGAQSRWLDASCGAFTDEEGQSRVRSVTNNN